MPSSSSRLRCGLASVGLLLLPSRAAIAAPAATAPVEPATPASHEFATSGPPIRRIDAIRRSTPIAIDGVLNEATWRAAPVSSGFWQREPDEGAPPDFQTEFRVAYDDRAIYVAVTARDPEPSKIRGLLTRRDQGSSSDWIFVAVDSYFDRRTAFVFGLNAAGVQSDVIRFDDTSQDGSWDAVWEGATSIGTDAWTAEFRIPYSQLRFSNASIQKWGLQVARVVQRTNETTYWNPVPRDKPQFVSRFGELHGIHDIGATRRIELLPYLLGGGRLDTRDGLDPLNQARRPLGAIGLDAKYGISSNLTLSVSINPDFGQVEADPSQVNLTAQETFFREKRPFFLEGADILRFNLGDGDGEGGETLFYSRRIGAPPHSSGFDEVQGAAYATEVDATSIYGATKLSGKSASGWSIGIMNALTARETSDVDALTRSVETVVIEPFSSYTVANLRRDFNRGRTSVGAAATAVNRALPSSRLRWLHSSAYAGGLNVAHRFPGNRWQVNGALSGTYVRGDAEAIDATQTASQHYFQRPDAVHLDYDPTRTHLSGAGFVGKLFRGGTHWNIATGMNTRSPGFEANDLGFQREADFINNWAWGQYRDDTPGNTLNQYSIASSMWTSSNWAPRHLALGGDVNARVQLRNYWGVRGGVSLTRQTLNTRLLRGGPGVRGDTRIGSKLDFSTDGRANVRGDFGGDLALTPGARTFSGGLDGEITIQARSNAALSLSPFVRRRRDELQYIDQVADSAGDTHFLLGRIDQTTAGVTIRFDYTVSPTMSLQLYAQPFVSAGSYDRYKEVAQARARRFDSRYHTFSDSELSETDGTIAVTPADGSAGFTIGRPDFNFRELRSTAVARWEYSPGSILFVVWSQGRSSDTDSGAFRLGKDLTGLARASGEHVVLAKLTWWWGG